MNVVMLSFINKPFMQSAIKLNVVMLSKLSGANKPLMQSVVILIVVAPCRSSIRSTLKARAKMRQDILNPKKICSMNDDNIGYQHITDKLLLGSVSGVSRDGSP